MALFKPYTGNSAEIDWENFELHPGYVYFCEDDRKLIIDTENGRYTLNAAESNYLVSEDGEYLVEPDNVVLYTDLDEDPLPIERGGTGGRTAGNARAALNVYSKNQVYTKTETIEKINDFLNVATSLCFSITLSASGWATDGEGYSQTVAISDLFANVPPIVTCTENKEEYSNIISATATSQQGVSFYTEILPTADIKLIVTDIR